MPRLSGEEKRKIAESPKRKAALAEARWVARRLFKLIQEMPVGIDDLDPELGAYLSAHERPANWLMNGAVDD